MQTRQRLFRTRSPWDESRLTGLVFRVLAMSASGKTREYDSSEDEDGDEFEETGDLQLCVPGEYVDESSSGAEDAYTTKCGGMPVRVIAVDVAVQRIRALILLFSPRPGSWQPAPRDRTAVCAASRCGW